MNKEQFAKFSPQLIEQLGKGGAFLTVFDGQETNTMTIGWATVGIMWGKPIMVVAVRYSRHTYQLLEKTGEFTVSVPASGELKEALAFCGTKSGRDYDKFKECKLTPQSGKEMDTPIVTECDLHFECEVVYQQAMEPRLVDESIKERFYANGNYHVLYYGEVLSCYTAEK